MKFTIIFSIAAMVLSIAPAMAQSSQRHYGQQYYGQHEDYRGQHRGWNTRNVSDPSFGNRAGINNARRTGRCVTDLGYGRYEYCGW